MSKGNNSVFIYGASGHAKVIIDIIEKEKKYNISYIIDDNPDLFDQYFFGYHVRGGKSKITFAYSEPDKAIVAIGDNTTRQKICNWLVKNGIELVTPVHPSAQIAREVQIGTGTVIMANTVINSASVIGKNVIVNTGATLDHDCVIGDNVHLAPGSTLCGTVKVGRNSFVGAASTVIQNITIGKNVFIGAGVVVVKDIPDNSKVIGRVKTSKQTF